MAILLSAAVAWTVIGGLASVQLDRWWFAELTDAPVWRKMVTAKLTLAAVSGVVSLALMLGFNRRALRVPAPPDQRTFRPIEFIAGRIGPARVWLAYALPLYFGYLIIGASTGYWKQWLLFRSSQSLDTEVPVVGGDLSYHLFKLPLVTTTTAWLLSVLLVTFVMSATIFILAGALRLPIGGRSSAPAALRQLALLGSLWLTVKAIEYWWVSYPSLASRSDGRFDGAGYAVMHGPGISLRLLAVLALIAAIALAGYSLRKIDLRWPGAIIATLIIMHLIMVIAVPAALQRFIVTPAEAERELPYIAHNLEGTRRAYGLDAVTMSTITVADGSDQRFAIDRLPIFDTDQLPVPLQVLQGTTGTKVHDVDLDRYDIDGALRPVYLASRNAASGELPESGWVQRHLVYTHGEGIIAAPADATTASGVLDFGALDLSADAQSFPLYYGEALSNWYVVTSTERTEVGGVTHTGGNGVAINSNWRRAVASLGIGDFNLLMSSELTDESQLLYRRSITERVGAIAPFLTIDKDPYPVVVDDGVLWVVDAYSTATTYPYSQLARTTGIGAGVNYMRRAAVVTVDAYDGAVNVYRTDTESGLAADPLLDAWDRALPGVMQPAVAMPADVADHLRYGADLFSVQTKMLGQYHVDSAELLFSGTDAWVVAQSPGVSAEDSGTGASPTVWEFVPTSGGESWSAIRAYSPGGGANPSSTRDELSALARGDHTTGEMELIVVRSADNRQITSPSVAQSLIAADPEVSQLFTLLNANGSKVVFGPMTPILSEDSLVWIRPVIVTSAAPTSTPRLYAFMAVSNGEVGVGSTPSEALAAAIP